MKRKAAAAAHDETDDDDVVVIAGSTPGKRPKSTDPIDLDPFSLTDDEPVQLEVELEDDFKCKLCQYSTSDWDSYFEHTTTCENRDASERAIYHSRVQAESEDGGDGDEGQDVTACVDQVVKATEGQEAELFGHSFENSEAGEEASVEVAMEDVDQVPESLGDELVQNFLDHIHSAQTQDLEPRPAESEPEVLPLDHQSSAEDDRVKDLNKKEFELRTVPCQDQPPTNQALAGDRELSVSDLVPAMDQSRPSCRKRRKKCPKPKLWIQNFAQSEIRDLFPDHVTDDDDVDVDDIDDDNDTTREDWSCNADTTGSSRINQRLRLLSDLYLKASRRSACDHCMDKSDFSIGQTAKRLRLASDGGHLVRCSQCQFSTTRPSELADHILIRHPMPLPIRILDCSACGFRSASLVEIMQHYSRDHAS